MKKYDLRKIEQKLLSNIIPKSMAGFDISAFLSKHVTCKGEEIKILRPAEIQAVFDSKIIASY